VSTPAAEHADAGTTSPLSVRLFPARRDGSKEKFRGSCTTLDEAHPLPSASNAAPSRARTSARAEQNQATTEIVNPDTGDITTA